MLGNVFLPLVFIESLAGRLVVHEDKIDEAVSIPKKIQDNSFMLFPLYREVLELRLKAIITASIWRVIFK
jgi:hypothetical protein